MNHSELIERISRLQSVDRVPFALLSSGAWAVIRQGVGLEEALTRPAAQIAGWLFEGYTLADSAISWVGSGYNNIIVKAVGGKIKWRRKGTPDVVEPLLQSVDDISKFNPLDIQNDTEIRKIYATVSELVKLENGQRLVGGSMWGPFTLAGLLLEADALMRLTIKDKAALDKLLRFSSELYLSYIQGYIDAGARVVFMAEPSASGDMISKRHFKEAVLPYIKNINETLKKQDVIVGLHICGNTFLDLIVESGTQIMSLDYKIPLKNARAAFKGKIAFSGNLNPVDVVQMGTKEEIRAKVLESIEEGGTDSGYIVMPGCDIPPSTPLENLQTISQTVNQYKIRER